MVSLEAMKTLSIILILFQISFFSVLGAAIPPQHYDPEKINFSGIFPGAPDSREFDRYTGMLAFVDVSEHDLARNIDFFRLNPNRIGLIYLAPGLSPNATASLPANCAVYNSAVLDEILNGLSDDSKDRLQKFSFYLRPKLVQDISIAPGVDFQTHFNIFLITRALFLKNLVTCMSPDDIELLLNFFTKNESSAEDDAIGELFLSHFQLNWFKKDLTGWNFPRRELLSAVANFFAKWSSDSAYFLKASKVLSGISWKSESCDSFVESGQMVFRLLANAYPLVSATLDFRPHHVTENTQDPPKKFFALLYYHFLEPVAYKYGPDIDQRFYLYLEALSAIYFALEGQEPETEELKHFKREVKSKFILSLTNFHSCVTTGLWIEEGIENYFFRTLPPSIGTLYLALADKRDEGVRYLRFPFYHKIIFPTS